VVEVFERWEEFTFLQVGYDELCDHGAGDGLMFHQVARHVVHLRPVLQEQHQLLKPVHQSTRVRLGLNTPAAESD